MYRTMLALSATIVMIAVSACTYTFTHEGTTHIVEEHPDGRKTWTRKNGATQETIRIDGMSKREIRRIVFPRQEVFGGETEQNPIAIDYRYEYRFDVYDTSDNMVGTVAIETFADFVAMIPIVYQMGGLPAPTQLEIDALAAEMSNWWVDPETDWHNNN